ncbi:MAG: hypothetical protein PWQ91_28 [Eubacteriales bacterium]|nr:hypothetical protein [Eubacteriales bacterium]MDN5362967.1 hypothetical protein [Eubacteriales bacterium]
MANLAKMARYLRIPPRFCVTAHAYRETFKH